ncbi:MAG: hypothetical protein D6681_02940 [Calditrichaeota bacterium]|nr:MAG: hypothetical protein D6681_02940 [Calditrichota bacterium]
MNLHPAHFVAVFGGACAGSEAARRLAERGIYVAVFDQQMLPYGKIEDGLPKWHVKLRNKEEAKIDQNLSHPNIFFVPGTKLGRDIDFQDVVTHWGFSAVLLASGAWRDRPLPVEGIDRYVEKGLYYQNPFVDWFNHHHEPGYDRYHYHVEDGAIVVGGGLASIDVVKILMLETVSQALRERGHEVDVITLEHGGIPKTLKELGLRFEDLGLKGCTLFYRRRAIDMPLASMPPDASPEKVAQVQKVREKILKNAMEKYLFHFQPNAVPVDKIVEGDRLVGLVFRKTEIVDGRVKQLPGTEFEVRAPLVISSIGSIPEPIPGIPTRGELFAIADEETGQLEGFPHVFALGNAVTGRGNIRESELHARKVVTHVMDEFLKWRPEDYQAMEQCDWSDEALAREKGLLSVEQIQAILKRVQEYQQRVGYHGDYRRWVEAHRPVRLEEMVS